MTATERLLGVLVVVGAAALRVVQLGAEPLGPREAAGTWPAWAAALGPGGPASPPGAPPESALLFGGQWSLFWLAGGATDALARAWPAALGTTLVAVPWLMRPAIGREATLVLAALLAVEPVLVRTSRLADGAIASGLGAFLVVACVVRARAGSAGDADGERARWRWLRAAAVSLGLLVASGPAAWSYLLLLGVAGALTTGPGGPARRPRASAGGLVSRLLGLTAISAVLGATVALTRPQGLPAVSASLTTWILQWLDVPGPSDLGRLLGRLLLEQPLTLSLGILGLIAGGRGAGKARGRRQVAALLTTLVLALAMAWADRASVVGRLPLTLLLTLTAALALAEASSGLVPPPGRGSRLATAAVAVGIAVLALITLRGAVQPPVLREAALAGARLLAADAASLCAGGVGDARECPVRVVGDPQADPVLAWYLRDLERLRWVSSLPLDVGGQLPSPLIVTPEAGAGRFPDGYAGSRYRIRVGPAGLVGVILWVPLDGSERREPASPPSEPES